MSLLTAVPADAKPTRRRVAKATKAQPAEKTKLSLYLSPKVAKALGVHAVMTGESQSAVAEAILAEALRRFVVSDRAKSDDRAMVEGSADQAS